MWEELQGWTSDKGRGMTSSCYIARIEGWTRTSGGVCIPWVEEHSTCGQQKVAQRMWAPGSCWGKMRRHPYKIYYELSVHLMGLPLLFLELCEPKSSAHMCPALKVVRISIRH